ncbi:hypothetical protein Peur_060054 [Populus x canadensis]
MRIIEWFGLILYILWLIHLFNEKKKEKKKRKSSGLIHWVWKQTIKPNSGKLSPKKRRCWATTIERVDLEIRLFPNTDMEFYVLELELTGIESCFCCSF